MNKEHLTFEAHYYRAMKLDKIIIQSLVKEI